MNTPFAFGKRITQYFGNKRYVKINGRWVEYYAQYGFNGHEGLDLVPIVPTNINVRCVEDGVVYMDNDLLRDNYGVHSVVRNYTTGREWWYCHLRGNNTYKNQVIKREDLIGQMGGSGRTLNQFATHLHLGLRLITKSGAIKNYGNGWKGFINPLPVLDLLNK